METHTLKSPQSWSEDVLKNLNTMRYSGVLCDVKIVLPGNLMLEAHSCVLSAASQFFRTILEGAESPELDFRDFPAKTLEQILMYIYTGEITVFTADISVLHSVAEMLHIPVLLDLTGDILKADESITVDDGSDVVSEQVKDDEDQGGMIINVIPEDDIIAEAEIERPNGSGDPIMQVEPAADTCTTDEMTVAIEPDMSQDDLGMLQSVLQSQGFTLELDAEQQNLDNSEQLQQNLDTEDSGAGEPQKEEGYHCGECNIGYTADIPYYKHMKYRHAMTVPIEIYKILEQEKNERRTQNKIGKSLVAGTGVADESSRFYENSPRVKTERENTAENTENVEPSQEKEHSLDEEISQDERNSPVKSADKSPSTSPVKSPRLAASRRSGRKSKTISFVDNKDEDDEMDKDTDTNLAKSPKKKPNKVKKKRVKPTEDDLVCKICERKFPILSQLKLHEFVHTGERPHSCETCGKGFTQLGNLKAHQRVHTKERPFQCAECGRSFTQSGILQVHMRTHTGERPHVCVQCGRTFSSATNLYAHQRCHTGDKPYKCPVCEKSFSQLSNLTMHQRLHTGERYKCPDCTKSFTAHTNYIRHLRRHMNVRPIPCPDCAKRFVNTNEMRAHQRLKHMRTVTKVETVSELQTIEESVDVCSQDIMMQS